MIVATTLILFLYTVLFLFAGKRNVPADTHICLVPFCKISSLIVESPHIKRIFTDSVKEDLNTLYPIAAQNKKVKKYYLKKCTIFLAIIFGGTILSLLLAISSMTSGILKQGNQIERNTFGKSEILLQLQAAIGDKKEEIQLRIGALEYTEKEIEHVFDEVEEELLTKVIAENESRENVMTDLFFLTDSSTYPVEIDWESSDYEYVDFEGRVHSEELTESYPVMLRATLSYKEWQREVEFGIVLLPKEYTEEEKRKRALEQAIQKAEEEQATQEMLVLPSEIEGEKIFYREKKEDISQIIIIVAAIAAVLVFFLKDRDLKKEVEEKNKELIMEYPEFVSKLTLFISAGMPVKTAITKLAIDYKTEQKKGRKKSYLYEELLIVVREMENGIYEEKAYDNFGKRCRAAPYLKLSGLLSQNLRRGQAGLISLLWQESEEAFIERKNNAKRLGEEAGTKLLLPMMLMLGVVMIIIIVPAFLTFQI